MAETTAITEPGITFQFPEVKQAEDLIDFMGCGKRKGQGGQDVKFQEVGLYRQSERDGLKNGTFHSSAGRTCTAAQSRQAFDVGSQAKWGVPASVVALGTG
jgi:hypothetical protein